MTTANPTLHEIIARVPAWSQARQVESSFLAGGLSNLNYRVDVDGESYVVRVCGQGLELLGVNRDHEYACSLIAAETGVAPEVIHYFPELGALVTRFIAGAKLPAAQIGTRENIARVTQAIRKLHAARPFPAVWSPFRTLETYRANAERLGCPMPADIDELLAQAAQTERALYRDGAPTLVPCHNDLLNENFLDDGAIRIIDYEYAAMGDAFFDLANFSSHHQFNDEQDEWLLASYFNDRDDSTLSWSKDATRSYDRMVRPAQHAGLVTEATRTRLQQMKLISDLREALWGVVQIRVASVNFDYQAYANEWFERYRAKRDAANRKT